MRRAPEFGIEAPLTGVDWPAIRDRAFSRTDEISAEGRRSRAESDDVTLIEGRARFTGPHDLAVDDGTKITADQIVLATGAGQKMIPARSSGGPPSTSSVKCVRARSGRPLVPCTETMTAPRPVLTR